MLIAEDVLLLLTDDRTGKPVVDSTRLPLALAGAALVELVLANRVAVTDGGRWGSGPRVAVVDPTPLGDRVLDEALARIRGRRQPVPATTVLNALTKGLADALRKRLVERGILRAEEGRVLGIFPTRVWPAADSRHEQALRSQLWDVVVRGRPASDRDLCLVALLHAVDQVPKQFAADGMTAKQLRERAKALAAGNVGGDAVRRAIEAANAAIMASITAASAVAVTSG